VKIVVTLDRSGADSSSVPVAEAFKKTDRRHGPRHAVHERIPPWSTPQNQKIAVRRKRSALVTGNGNCDEFMADRAPIRTALVEIWWARTFLKDIPQNDALASCGRARCRASDQARFPELPEPKAHKRANISAWYPGPPLDWRMIGRASSLGASDDREKIESFGDDPLPSFITDTLLALIFTTRGAVGQVGSRARRDRNGYLVRLVRTANPVEPSRSTLHRLYICPREMDNARRACQKIGTGDKAHRSSIRVGVLGGGLQGCCAALALAERR
jgi:hypothetical protein